MKKDRLYFLTFVSIAVIFLIIASIGNTYFIKVSANQLIELQLQASEREAQEVAKLLGFQLELNTKKEEMVSKLQQAIENTADETSFISAFNWSGKVVAHPNITKVGQKIVSNQELLNALKDEGNTNALYEILLTQRSTDTQGELPITEIVHVAPIKNSDLLIAAHINMAKVMSEVQKLKTSFYIIFSLMGVLIIVSSFFAVRVIGSYYEKQLEAKNTNLESELLNLSKLNADLVNYQQRVTKETAKNEAQQDKPFKEVENTSELNVTPKLAQDEKLTDSSKKRILTYMRNELVPVIINEVAYIYTEDTITYVVTNKGKKSTTNASLDDLLSSLDTTLFFRANRQFIIGITSIKKIIKYGNSQLKILINGADAEIIISKNKASEFRQWLNS